MKKGLVIVRSLTAKSGKSRFTEYTAIKESDVNGFDTLVKQGKIKEFNSYEEVLAFQKKVGFKKPVKNIWEAPIEKDEPKGEAEYSEEQETEIARMKEKYSKDELQAQCVEKFGEEQKGEKRDLVIKLLGIL